MAKYEIGFKKGKTEVETYWRMWLWIKESENSIIEVLGIWFRKIILKDRV